jgi:hypothetical protein
MKINLEQLEEMQVELFKKQCDLDIQKAMVKHFIKKEKAKQLTLTDVVRCVCKIPEPRLKVSENGTYAYCEKCAKTYLQI